LFDAAHIGWRYPVKLVREEESNAKTMAFSFYGPTCDDLDHMAGPFELPADVRPGDYIEVGMLGAYGCAMRTGFNGFGVEDQVVVDDEPMASLYTDAAERKRATNVITL
jgi:ornithine decarboxylase